MAQMTRNDFARLCEREMKPPYIGYMWDSGSLMVHIGDVPRRYTVEGGLLWPSEAALPQRQPYLSKRKPKISKYRKGDLTKLEKDIARLEKAGRLLIVIRADEHGNVTREDVGWLMEGGGVPWRYVPRPLARRR